MSPILGIWASSIQPSLNAGSFESIATVTVGAGGAGSVAFTSIPQTYTHLQLRCISRDSVAGSSGYVFSIQPNNTAGAYFHWILGDGGAASATSGSGAILASISASAGNTANVFGVGIVDILDYANTNKNKTFRSLTGFDSNGSGQVYLISGLYNSTNAITSLYLYSNNFVQYSTFALYGIKGA